MTAESTKSSPTDVVTALDRASEELVARRLREARPDDGLLGEEGSAAAGTSGVRMIPSLSPPAEKTQIPPGPAQ